MNIRSVLKSRAALSCFAVLFCQTYAASAQMLRVRVVDARNGDAISKQSVWVQFYESPANRLFRQIQYETGRDGLVEFPVPAPQPSQIFVSLPLGSFRCSSVVQVAPADVVAHGATGQYDCAPAKAAKDLKAKPGEIILFVRPFTLWQRLLAPLLRE